MIELLVTSSHLLHMITLVYPLARAFAIQHIYEVIGNWGYLWMHSHSSATATGYNESWRGVLLCVLLVSQGSDSVDSLFVLPNPVLTLKPLWILALKQVIGLLETLACLSVQACCASVDIIKCTLQLQGSKLDALVMPHFLYFINKTRLHIIACLKIFCRIKLSSIYKYYLCSTVLHLMSFFSCI